MIQNGSHANPALKHPALSMLPSGLFLMTSAFEGKRAGVLVSSVQPCAGDPPLVCVALRKGHWIEPIIRDSHVFAICLIDPNDRLVAKKFGDNGRHKDPVDPFDCMPLERLSTGAPVVKRALAALDCEVVRHMDIEADYGLYVGVVRASRVYGAQSQAAPGASMPVQQTPPSMSA